MTYDMMRLFYAVIGEASEALKREEFYQQEAIRLGASEKTAHLVADANALACYNTGKRYMCNRLCDLILGVNKRD